jgi:hypothetical protein
MPKSAQFGRIGKKMTKKKIVDAYAEIVLRVKDSQLAHMHSRDPEIVWDVLAQVHHARGLVTWLALWRLFLTLVKVTEEAMSSVATVMTDVFQKNEINLLRKFAKIVRIFDKVDDSKKRGVI